MYGIGREGSSCCDKMSDEPGGHSHGSIFIEVQIPKDFWKSAGYHVRFNTRHWVRLVSELNSCLKINLVPSDQSVFFRTPVSALENFVCLLNNFWKEWQYLFAFEKLSSGFSSNVLKILLQLREISVMVIYCLRLLWDLFTITGNIIIILDFRDCADSLDTYLKIVIKRVQLTNKSQSMHSAMQHIPKQKLKKCFRKKTGFYQLLQHAALHPPLCNLSWAVGRDRGGLETSLLLLWWEKQWQKENVHVPSTATVNWPPLFLAFLLERCILKYVHIPPCLCARRLHRHTNHQCCCCAFSNMGEDRSFELLCEGSCTCMQQFGNVSGKRILPWLMCDVELITGSATPPPLLPFQ